jgi:hypothetical protein
MWQRVADCYARLDGDDRAAAEDWLASLGGLELFRLPIPRRVARRNNRLMPAL